MSTVNNSNGSQERRESVKRIYKFISSVLGAIVLILGANILTSDMHHSTLADIARWLSTELGPTLYSIVTISLGGILILLSVIWLLLTLYFWLDNYLNYYGPGSDRILDDYLSKVIERNRTLNPRQDIDIKPGELSEQARILTSTDMALDEMFVPLRVRSLADFYSSDEDSSQDGCNSILQLHLLNALGIMLNSRVVSMPKSLQQDIAQRLFECYGAFLDQGRYIPLQHRIETLTSRWLREQPQYEKGQGWDSLPLLATWHDALCNHKFPMRQEGAVRLLAAIIHEFPGVFEQQSLPELICFALLPPLFQLAKARDYACPSELRRHFWDDVKQAHAASPRIEAYAFIALRLLDTLYSPAGQLYKDWNKQDDEIDGFLSTLTEYSEEIGFLMTPAATTYYEEKRYLDAVHTWQQAIKEKKTSSRSRSDLQRQLLHLSKTARYTFAHLFKHLLAHEIDIKGSKSWREQWDDLLQEEMNRGHNATYQQALLLRQTIYTTGPTNQREESRRRIVEHLLTALASLPPRPEDGDQEVVEATKPYNGVQVQALTAIINTYILYDGRKYDPHSSRLLCDVLRPYYVRNFFDWLDMPFGIPTKNNHDFSRILQGNALQTMQQIYIWLDQQIYPNTLQGAMRELQYRLNLKESLVRENCLDALYDLLQRPFHEGSWAIVLLALHSILNHRTSMINDLVGVPNTQKLKAALEEFQKNAASKLKREHHILISAIQFIIEKMEREEEWSTPSLPYKTGSLSSVSDLDSLAKNVRELRTRNKFSRREIEEVLFKAWINTEPLPEETQKSVYARTAQQIAWEILTGENITVSPSNSKLGRQSTARAGLGAGVTGFWRFVSKNSRAARSQNAEKLAYPFDLNEEALSYVIDSLDNKDPMIRFACAQLLQQCKRPPDKERLEIVQKIIKLLTDPPLTSSLLDTPDTQKVWRLDDVLFRALDALQV